MTLASGCWGLYTMAWAVWRNTGVVESVWKTSLLLSDWAVKHCCCGPGVGTGVSGFVGCEGLRLAGQIITWCLPLQLWHLNLAEQLRLLWSFRRQTKHLPYFFKSSLRASTFGTVWQSFDGCFPLQKVKVRQLASPLVNKACVVPSSLRFGFSGEGCPLFTVDPPAPSLASSSLWKYQAADLIASHHLPFLS